MAVFRFADIAFNSTEKRSPTVEDMQTYIGLEHLDSDSLMVSKWGSSVPIKGDKLMMHKGDVLFGKRNAYLRRTAIAPHDGLFSAHGMVLRPRATVIHPQLFPLFLSSKIFYDAAIRISIGSLSPTINWRDLAELEFNLPPIEEQPKLAELLWAFEATKEAYKRLLALTDELVKAQFVEMFGDPATNPMGWPLGTIRDIVNEVKYGSSRPAVDNGAYPYLRMNNISYDGMLDLSDIKHIDIPDNELPNCTVKRGDVLFNRTNSKELVGKTCVYNQDEMMVLAGFVIRIRVNDKALPEFLSSFLNSNHSKQMLLGMCKSAIGQANINAQDLQDIAIYRPPINLQNQFVGVKESADQSKLAIQQSLSALEQARNVLMEKVFG